MNRLVVPPFVAPLGWHGFRPRPRGRVLIFTGHPPPLEQIARQVRSPTGMTHGVRGPEGARMHPAFAHGAKPEPAAIAPPRKRGKSTRAEPTCGPTP